jgi:hypothetical protein
MGYSPLLGQRPNDFTVNAFGSAGGSVLNSKVITAFDIYTPSELMLLLSRHQNYPGFRSVLRTWGFRKGCHTPTVGHYESPWIRNLVTIGTIVTASGGAGLPMVVSLPAASHYDTSVTINGGASLRASFPKKGHKIRLPDGEIVYITNKDVTTAPTAHRLTLVPADPTVDLDAVINVGESYAILYTEKAEGTGFADGDTPRVVKYSNNFAITKERVGATGSEMTNKTWFDPIPNKPGSFLLKAEEDTYQRFEEGYSAMLLFDKPTTNTALVEFAEGVGHDMPLKGQEGFYSFVEDNGNEVTYTVGSWVMDDFDKIAHKMEDERAGADSFCVWFGQALYTENENVLRDFLNGDTAAFLSREWMGYGNVSQTMRDHYQLQSEEDYAIKIGFTAIRKNGVNFMFKRMHDFNYVQGMGSADYNFKNQAIVHPVGYKRNQFNGQLDGAVGYQYKELNGVSRENKVAVLNGVGAEVDGMNAVNEIDTRNTYMLAESCFHGTCANHMTLVRPS